MQMRWVCRLRLHLQILQLHLILQALQHLWALFPLQQLFQRPKHTEEGAPRKRKHSQRSDRLHLHKEQLRNMPCVN